MSKQNITQKKGLLMEKKNIGKKNIMCYNCNEIKHISRFYKKPWKKQNNLTKKGDKNTVHISILDANLAIGGNDTNEEVLGDKVFQDFEDKIVVLSVEIDRHD